MFQNKEISIMRLSLIFLAMSIVPVTYAANFYTIIGPDGRPIIVQKPIESENKQKIKTQSQAEKKQNSQASTSIQQAPRVEKSQASIAVAPLSSEQKQQNINHTANISQNKLTGQSDTQPSPQTTTNRIIENSVTKKVETIEQKDISPTHQEIKPISPSKPTNLTATENNQVTSPINNKTEVFTEKKTETVQENKKATDTEKNANITEIDGVQYVNNEYLEDREFNLEGKKRFYVMPETGAMAGGRFETVERQKGLSQSLLDRIRQRKPLEHKAITLATTYYRLPKEEVIQTLEQSCFTGKKVEKAKTMSLKNQEVSFFPVAPIKENFAYEIVKLDADIQNILFSSYASSQKKPSYYWPLVVFLDEKGCVVEGVSGFKNEEQNESVTHYASLEGVLKKPDSAHYLFMTPLSQAIDIQNHELTNQGQIKLSVIQ
ncbi:putative pilus assembly protein FilE [Acinetobacter sp. Marseille-Q1618]|uniref:putative pilus assembly protein FilE n=1 Tax=Acinetobacter sp. Marseille-Q1618 TaxID=2697502 RepID=UPI0020C5982C|nr:putative pilus assembly protein FilE [Acinetobacter sp. Marseille-Q1618]